MIAKMIPEIKIAATDAAGLAETSQPRAETEGDPFGEVERLEQNLLHALERRGDRFRHADFVRMITG